MKNLIPTITIICLAGLLSACATETVDSEFFGDIEGTVIHAETNNGIAGVSIETTPATEAKLTDAEGNFSLTDIPTGSYQIRVSKPDYNSKIVTIMVREDKTSSAKIILEPNQENTSLKQNIKAEVTSWYQKGSTDSSFVDIEYQISNTSAETPVSRFEVYFDIFTDKETYHYEVGNEALGAGEKNFGSFEKFVKDATVDSVKISGIWINEQEE